jgi:hypothetical protein
MLSNIFMIEQADNQVQQAVLPTTDNISSLGHPGNGKCFGEPPAMQALAALAAHPCLGKRQLAS